MCIRDSLLAGPVAPPVIPAKLLSTKNLSATILKLEYDQPVAPFALAAPAQGSLTVGMSGTTLDLGRPVTFAQLEFTIENPGYRRGQGQPFDLQVQQADGSWRSVHSGRVFGSIYSKCFAPVTAQHIKLVIAATVRQFDLFPERLEKN